MCLGCRVHKDKRELIRVVRTPTGEIELDSTGRKAGRGAYICPDAACLKKAIKGKGLEKSLQRNIPEDVVTRLMRNIGDVP
ncbi:MAG: YlxR family protein [Bacillota bacterium]